MKEFQIKETPQKSKKNLENILLFLLFPLFFFIVSQNLSSSIGFDIRGFVDTYHAVRLQDPYDWMSSRTRLRMEFQSNMDQASAFVSFNLVHNNVLTSKTGFELREAYLQYAARGWDIRIGRQIVVWGKADGLQILDIVSPVNYTEFLAQDYDDIRTPVDALKFRLLWDRANLELIWVPFFTPAVIPFNDDTNPWAVRLDIPENLDLLVLDPVSPEKKITSSEFFGKLSFTLPGIDFAFSGFYTWDDFGVFHMSYFNDTRGMGIELLQEYYRVGGLGFEFSLPVNNFVLRGEVAYFMDRRFEPEEISTPMIEKDSIKGLLGLDWFPGNDWTISGQLIDYVIFNYEDRIQDEAHTWITTLHISKDFFRDTLTISNTLYLGLNNGDFYNRFNFDYALTDALHVIAGVDLLGGGDGFFGRYRDNTEGFFKLKYSF